VDFLSENIRKIQAGVQHHNRTCALPATAILMYPTEHVRLGVGKLWGLPIHADERVRLGRFRIDCEGSAWRVEDELELYTQQLTAAPPKPPRAPVERPLAPRGVLD